MNIWETFYSVRVSGLAVGFDGLFTAMANVWDGNLTKDTAIPMNLFYGESDPGANEAWRPMDNGQRYLFPTSIVGGEIRL